MRLVGKTMRQVLRGRATPARLLQWAVGSLWLVEGALKLNTYFLFIGFQREASEAVASGNPFPLYAYLVRRFVLPHALVFASLKAVGEVVVGLALISGWIVPAACWGALFMNANFFLGAGWLSTIHYTANGLLAFIEIGLLLEARRRPSKALGWRQEPGAKAIARVRNSDGRADAAAAGAGGDSQRSGGPPAGTTWFWRVGLPSALGVVWLWNAWDLVRFGSVSHGLLHLVVGAVTTGYPAPVAQWLLLHGLALSPVIAWGLLLAEVALGTACLCGFAVHPAVALAPAAFMFIVLGPSEYLQYLFYALVIVCHAAAWWAANGRVRARVAPGVVGCIG